MRSSNSSRVRRPAVYASRKVATTASRSASEARIGSSVAMGKSSPRDAGLFNGTAPINMIWGMSVPPTTGNQFIVCGDNPLAYRIARELTRRYGEDVVVLLDDTLKNHGPQIAALPGVTVV